MKFCKGTVTILLIFSNILIAQERGYDPGQLQEETTNPKIYQLEQTIKKLETASSALSSLHTQLTANSAAVFQLNTQATSTLQNNIYKTFFKGSLDIINKVTSPLNSVLELANDAILSLVAEPMLCKTENQRTFLNRFNSASYYRNTKLRLMYSSLGLITSMPLNRFDDDAKPFAFSKPWWGTPNGLPDDETKMVIKKINVIKNLSDMVYKKTEEELTKIRSEREEIINMIAEYKADLAELKAKDAEDKRIAKETEEWVSRMRSRQGIMPSGEQQEMNPTQFRTPHDTPEINQKLDEVFAERNRKREEENELRADMERQKELQRQKEADARVYIDSETPRHVLAKEPVDLILRAYPEDIEGTFVFTVNDKEVYKTDTYKKTNSTKYTYTFQDAGVYDIQLKLFLGGQYNDTYTDQWYVDENPLFTPFPVFGGKGDEGAPAYDPKLEGTKKLKLELAGFCKYWVEYSGGKVYLTGHYNTFTGQQVQYKSEPLAPFQANDAEKGLMMTQSGTGYHIYQTIGGSGDVNPYIITRMRGSDIEILHRFNAAWMQVKPEGGLVKINIEYKETKGGTVKTIVLD